MKKLCLLLLLLIPVLGKTQLQLSEQGNIHVVTCGPYQGELYSAFGHSAIRVVDPERRIDLIFNYGVFDFNQPNFYLNFAKGHLNYQLAVSYYEPFKQSYIRQNRYIHEQVLNLSPGQKQELFDFLQWNAQPENRGYAYDYFYDNCATRIRDAVQNQFGNAVRFDSNYVIAKHSIRDLCDIYLEQQPWGDLGIDLCLGIPMDKKASSYEYMFLPDYIELGFNGASIMKDGRWQPLVSETLITYESRPEEPATTFFNPLVVFIILFIIGVWITWRGVKRKKAYAGFDVLLFSILGIIGWLLLVLWLFTDHTAAARNMNMIWAIPTHFPVALLLLRRNKPGFLKVYFRLTGIISLVTLIAWAFLPQDLHYSLIPLVMLILVRSVFIRQFLLGKIRAGANES